MTFRGQVARSSFHGWTEIDIELVESQPEPPRTPRGKPKAMPPSAKAKAAQARELNGVVQI